MTDILSQTFFHNSINSKLNSDYTSLYSSCKIQLTTKVTIQTKERKPKQASF